ncbi:hypothetical protein A6A04_09685 [Paramagnetospirillum marisnigri]|uniref:Sensory/regulatory protein RpfC n=1 Tax=Paramagnetospirillum marisnigri TaxID=1285242 RepID=A0A178M4H7_9PROT|nr:ATP-binding protein [Paramagnetospirillum marisnigri]OAN42966.1 hypothetical protein A6A04_09685 [Paramagnetospirillum marisnigri]
MATRHFIRWIRALPIAWRIPLVVVLNLFVALAVGGLGWHAASVVNADLDQLRQVQTRTGALADIDIRAGRLQGLIRQYLANPSDDLLKDAMRRSEELFVAMGDATAHEKPLSADAVAMHEAARRFVAGFQTLKAINADISRLYESQVLQATSEMSGLYAILNSTARTRSGDQLAPTLVKSHENFVETLIAINVFYFNGNPARAVDAQASLDRMTATMPVLAQLAGNDLQRDALQVLEQRGRSLTGAIDTMSRAFDERSRILADEVDANQEAMSEAIDRLIAQGRAREDKLQSRSKAQLTQLAVAGALAAGLLLAFSALVSWMIGQSIRAPLLSLREAMEAGAEGDWTREVEGRDLHDELAAMARTVEVFKRNAVEKLRLELEREEAGRRSDEAKRRTLQDLLAQMEAHEHPISLTGPVAAVAETEAAEIAAVFNRVLAKFQEASQERDAAIRALTEAKEAAETANLAKSSFLAAMSHEIRTPMNGVVGLLELLGLTRLDEDQRDLIATTRESGLALLRIIDDVLDFSKIEAGRMELERLPVSLVQLIDGVLHLITPDATAKGITLSGFVDPALPSLVLADSVRLRQILVNLAGNAVKFTPSGRVAIHAEQAGRGTDGRILVRLRVVDTGIGISPALRDRLFQPFVQAETSTTRQFGGTGLGLSITRRLVELMDGSIGVDSQPGVGSSFWCVLALDAAATAELEPVVEPDFMGIRILVALPEAEELTDTAQEVERLGAAVVRLARLAPVASEPALAHFDVAVVDAAEILDTGRGALTTSPLLLVGGETQGRFDLERLPNCVGFLGRPLERNQVVIAIASALGGSGPVAHCRPVCAPLQPSLDLASPRWDGPPVLVAEDHPVNQQVILRQLDMLGYPAELAPDGAAALAAWRSKRFAAVLTDCHMPVMDGFQLTEAIRAEEALAGAPRIPIIALTANALSGESERCLEAGMDRYLAKPVDLIRLRDALDAVLRIDPKII